MNEPALELPVWAPRVDREKIRRVYASDALGQGRIDTELLDDVWVSIYLRCQSILAATAAATRGRITCPRCKAVEVKGDETGMLTCPSCSWSGVTWKQYFKTIQHKQLSAGGAQFAFEAYVNDFESARTPHEKLLLIDRLIHAFHGDMQKKPTRPAAVNVIHGKCREVIELIENLAFGDGTIPSLRQSRDDWRQKKDQSGYWNYNK